MKKILSAVMLITMGHFALPQNLKNSPITVNPEVSTSTEPSSAVNPSYVNTKAVRNFKKTFKGVDSEKWYEMPDGYRVNFTLNGVRHRLDYDKKGNWRYTIRYISEKNLPTDVRRYVASNYLDYSVTTIEEIQSPRNPITFVIHLEGSKNFINLRVSDNEVSELQKINKS